MTLAAVCAWSQTKRDSVTLLAAAAEDTRRLAWTSALGKLKSLPERVPELADYSRFYSGTAHFELKNYGAALQEFDSVRQQTVLSPFAWRAQLQSAAALIELKREKEAIALLRKDHSKLPQPQTDILLAKAFRAAGDDVSAAIHLQRVYYGYPTSTEAAEAALTLGGLRQALGDRYPVPMAHALLGRAKSLASARRFADAKKELQAAAAQLGGADREIARVRAGVVDYQAKQYLSAYKYLKALEVSAPEADAERLYYLLACARRLDREGEMPSYVEALARKYPDSPWRLEAIVSLANIHLYRNEQDQFEPLYRACAESFPEAKEASFCHWKITWTNYLRKQGDAEDLFKSHLQRHPESEKVPASLYFLGRHAETRRNPGAAKVYYSEIDRRFPNHYYAMLARERLATAPLARATESVAAAEFVGTLKISTQRHEPAFEPLGATRARLQRAKLLESAGLMEWTEQELRFGARHDEQPHLITMELARVLARRGANDEALRAVKAYVPRYLSIPWDQAPLAFWRIAFPMPYRESLERNARQKSLDPFVVAGLIRQESEFNPKAVSVARALGLTQVMPSTGRELSRKNGIRRFTPSMLLQPEVNLKLGTYYLSQLLNSLNGKWEHALASYNGGKTRVLRWVQWGDFREPAEFVETIPINETRDYVQIVLRNADVYRRLYGDQARAAGAGGAR